MPYQVHGEVLSKKRKSIRSDARAASGDTKLWSQQGVAEQAGINRTTYSPMERNPNQAFEIENIHAVCRVLKLNPNDVIRVINPTDLDIIIDNKVDFRPVRAPDVDGWEASKLAMTLEPIELKLKGSSPESYVLEELRISIPDFSGAEEFMWLYEAMLVPGGNGYFGKVKDVEKRYEILPGTGYDGSNFTKRFVCRSEAPSGITWAEFHEALKTTSLTVLWLDLTLEFEHETFNKRIGLPVAEIQAHIEKKRREKGRILIRMQTRILQL